MLVRKKKSAFWIFLNSPFGIFILSSIFLAAVSSHIQNRYTESTLEHQRQARISKIRTELYHQFHLSCIALQYSPDEPTPSDLESLLAPLVSSFGSEELKFSGVVHPEHQGRNVMSLVYELGEIGDTEDRVLAARLWHLMVDFYTVLDSQIDGDPDSKLWWETAEKMLWGAWDLISIENHFMHEDYESYVFPEFNFGGSALENILGETPPLDLKEDE